MLYSIEREHLLKQSNLSATKKLKNWKRKATKLCLKYKLRLICNYLTFLMLIFLYTTMYYHLGLSIDLYNRGMDIQAY